MADIMRQLQPGEEVVCDLHPHWRRLAVPFVGVPMIAALSTFALLTGPGESPYRDAVLGVAVLLLLFLSGLPYLRWRATRYLVTDRRVLARSGIVTHLGAEVPLYRLDDVYFENTLADRLSRSGDLILDSGEQGQLRLVDVPRVEQVQETIHRLMEIDERRRRRLAEH